MIKLRINKQNLEIIFKKFEKLITEQNISELVMFFSKFNLLILEFLKKNPNENGNSEILNLILGIQSKIILNGSQNKLQEKKILIILLNLKKFFNYLKENKLKLASFNQKNYCKNFGEIFNGLVIINKKYFNSKNEEILNIILLISNFVQNNIISSNLDDFYLEILTINDNSSIKTKSFSLPIMIDYSFEIIEKNYDILNQVII